VNISANAVHPGVIRTNLFRNRTIVSGIFSNLTFKFICYFKR
jgi:WW domain-containing oxidoreductase